MFTVLLWITTTWLLRRAIRREWARITSHVSRWTAGAMAFRVSLPWRKRHPEPKWEI